MKTEKKFNQYKNRCWNMISAVTHWIFLHLPVSYRLHYTVRLVVLIISFSCLPLFSASPKTNYGKHVFVFQTFVDSPELKIIENILIEAYRRAGYKVRFVYSPDSSLGENLKLPRHEGYDGELARIDGMDEEYPELVKVYSPVSWVEPVAISRKNLSTRYGWYSIRQKKVGILVYSVFSNIVTIGSRRVTAKSIDELMKLLVTDKVDVVVLPALTAKMYVKKYMDAGVMLISPSLENILLYHYLNKKYAPLADELSKIIRNMLYDGTVAKIRERTLKNIFPEKRNAE